MQLVYPFTHFPEVVQCFIPATSECGEPRTSPCFTRPQASAPKGRIEPTSCLFQPKNFFAYNFEYITLCVAATQAQYVQDATQVSWILLCPSISCGRRLCPTVSKYTNNGILLIFPMSTSHVAAEDPADRDCTHSKLKEVSVRTQAIFQGIPWSPSSVGPVQVPAELKPTVSPTLHPNELC